MQLDNHLFPLSHQKRKLSCGLRTIQEKITIFFYLWVGSPKEVNSLDGEFQDLLYGWGLGGLIK